MSERKFRLQVSEEELRNLIQYHSLSIGSGYHTIDRSKRLHDLVRRLHNDAPEIEPAEATAAKEEPEQSW